MYKYICVCVCIIYIYACMRAWHCQWSFTYRWMLAWVKGMELLGKRWNATVRINASGVRWCLGSIVVASDWDVHRMVYETNMKPQNSDLCIHPDILNINVINSNMPNCCKQTYIARTSAWDRNLSLLLSSSMITREKGHTLHLLAQSGHSVVPGRLPGHWIGWSPHGPLTRCKPNHVRMSIVS